MRLLAKYLRGCHNFLLLTRFCCGTVSTSHPLPVRLESKVIKTPEFEQAEAHFAARLHHADFVKAHPEFTALKSAQPSLTESLHPAIAQASAPLMFKAPERRACPAEVRHVIPSLIVAECDAMRKTLNEADRRALTRRFTGAELTQPGALA